MSGFRTKRPYLLRHHRCNKYGRFVPEPDMSGSRTKRPYLLQQHHIYSGINARSHFQYSFKFTSLVSQAHNGVRRGRSCASSAVSMLSAATPRSSAQSWLPRRRGCEGRVGGHGQGGRGARSAVSWCRVVCSSRAGRRVVVRRSSR